MAVFISASAATAAALSFVFYFVAKRLKLCGKSLIIAVAVLNSVYCALFPLLFASLSGKNGQSAPSLQLWAVFTVLLFITAGYVVILLWRVVLHSPGVWLNAPLPAPDPVPVAKNAAIAKESVDTFQNIDKMGISNKPGQEIGQNYIETDINKAFDCLNGGRLEEAAGYFYSAITQRPPLYLEVQIVIQLCMVYSELGRSDLSLDIMGEYIEKYRNMLSDSDMAALKAGVSIIESMIAGIGGDGNEKN